MHVGCFVSSHAATILWDRLVTCGRLGAPSGPGLLASLTNASTVCALPLCGAANPGCSRLSDGFLNLCHRPPPEPSTASRSVVAIASLDDQVLLLRLQLPLAIHAARVAGLVRGITDAVLVAQLLFDLGIDLVDGLLVRHLKE